MAQKKRGLGRGLQALIPEAQAEAPVRRPTDVFFPEGRAARAAKADDGVKAEIGNEEKQPGAAEEATASGQAAHTSADIAATLLAPSKRASKNGRKGSGNRSRQPVEIARGVASVAAKRPASEIEKKAEKAVEAVSRETAQKDSDPGKKSVSRETGAPTVEAPDVAAAQPSDVDGAEAQDVVTEEVAVENGGSVATPGENGDGQGEDPSGLVPVPGATFAELPVELISPNPRQPRQVFDEEDIEELASSIKEVGLLQPIVVRRIDDEDGTRYELIMGERRLRASKHAGIETIPAIVRYTDDQDLLRDALLENLHRVQLNPLEEAAAYQALLEDFGCTHAELSRRIARSRSQISNTLRLMKLPGTVQRRLAAGVLSAGHARSLLGLPDHDAMETLAERIVSEGLSVRATEELVALHDEPGTTAKPSSERSRSLPLPALSTRLSDAFDTRVKVVRGAKKGKITIEFAGEDDLARLVEALAPGTSLDEV
ncbi:ParB/RepB/Spo0J family partition protein [Actinomyces marmotae]|uniref:ParB/RepB/Spo0J family partition protein n=1 Tax=Actinomyces marmotae TaxID=2737173 RepID=UPI00135AE366|nr:ParB/RepB/Spo0J family partition protein [Actinomyces marmotae]